jgi:hypothetical protein
MDENTEVEEAKKVGDEKAEIPFALREFGEIPEGYVPLYVRIKKTSLDFVAENGLRVEDNQRDKRASSLEKMFREEREKRGIEVDRGKCVFAFPRLPHLMRSPLSFNDDFVLLEIMVDPKKCLVADGEEITEADRERDLSTQVLDDKWARMHAETYWEESKTLNEYLAENHLGKMNDYDDYGMPEVLIPFDIPTSRIKVNTEYKPTQQYYE